MPAPHSASGVVTVVPSMRMDAVFWDPFHELDRLMQHSLFDFPRALRE